MQKMSPQSLSGPTNRPSPVHTTTHSNQWLFSSSPFPSTPLSPNEGTSSGDGPLLAPDKLVELITRCDQASVDTSSPCPFAVCPVTAQELAPPARRGKNLLQKVSNNANMASRLVLHKYKIKISRLDLDDEKVIKTKNVFNVSPRHARISPRA